MAITTIDAFDTTVQKSHMWLRELTDIGNFDSEEQAYTAMRAVLHSLRDRLTVDEAAQLASELPMLIRGLYYEGWKPAKAPNKERTLEEFLDSMRQSLRGNRLIDPQYSAVSVFQLLNEKISAGEIRDIKQMLPPEVRSLWPD
jgi:uncharacterized protein (DUF2267 family)